MTTPKQSDVQAPTPEVTDVSTPPTEIENLNELELTPEVLSSATDTSVSPDTQGFSKLGLSADILSVLTDLGYEAPTPVQAESIPILMAGDDLLAQAHTGTGKTAAFALPILSTLDVTLKAPQALIIAPTRELAIQVAEAFQSYAKQMKGFHVTPIYGGQDYQVQLRALKRGTHVIVGTPGRIMDHLRRGTLSTDALKTLVLDEADEMLKMGFIDDIEWILEQIKQDHQVGLFSATMPSSIQNIAKRYLKNAKKVKIKPMKSTVDAIDQAYIRIAQNQKLDLLTRFLEVEEVEAAIIFTRTKNCSAELAEKLQARGYEAAALNGDVNQAMRKKVVDRIKKGSLDIIVATDVAARGLDVDRVSHVINYDIPHDTESYVHRIGRTGRAGRKGTALLFVTPREHRLLKDIERAIQKTIKQIDPPSVKEMNEKRSKQLADKVLKIIEKSKKLGPYHEMVERIIAEGACEASDVAAALIYLMQQSNPLPERDIETAQADFGGEGRRPSRGRGRPSGGGNGRPSGGRGRPSGGRGRPSGGNGRSDGRRKSFGDRDRPSDEGRRSFGDKDKPSGERRKSFGDRDKPSGERGRSFGAKGKPSNGGRGKSFGAKGKPSSSGKGKSFGAKPKPSGQVRRSTKRP